MCLCNPNNKNTTTQIKFYSKRCGFLVIVRVVAVVHNTKFAFGRIYYASYNISVTEYQPITKFKVKNCVFF